MVLLNAAALRSWLTNQLATTQLLAPETIDVRERFSRYGLDSLGAVRLAKEISCLLERSISPTLVWEHPTIEALANHLALGTEVAPTGKLGVGMETEEPVALIGLACRFPGAPDIAGFWRLLFQGEDAVSEVPPDRGWEGVLSASGINAAERARIVRGAFLDCVDAFDPLFFGISPREAVLMDPQQRLMLELCWEALEDAGIAPRALAGSQTGVFAGAIWSDYGALLDRGGPAQIGPYSVTGSHRSIIANRISYLLGLMGPSLTVDSACSSALVVTHLACESLRRGESVVAIAGAVNLNLLAESALAVSRFGALSPEGRCYTFDARANGYVRGEGGGVVVLKMLSRAIADGDPIHAVIRASAVNNDGASNGLTAPNRAAQEAVLRTAWARSGVSPTEAQYVEAHGTGTALGDPIEARALGAVLGAGRPAESPLLIGSVKTNLGHLEGAAGMVGLLKLALSIEHRLLPPSLHFKSDNPHAPLAELGLSVPTSLREWPAPERPLVGGVSSFGLGGTNGHVVLEEWSAPVVEVLAVAAETPDALRAEVEAQRAALAVVGRTLQEICRVASRRLARAPATAGRERLAVVGRSSRAIDQGLAAFLDGARGAAIHAGSGIFEPSGVVFVFPGQGSQWHGMARQLLQSEPVFRTAILACEPHVRSFAGFSLIDELTSSKSASRLGEIEVSLP